MESRMDKIFQAYIDNEISLDEICTKFNITSWDFFKKLANFCNLHFVDLDEDNDFIYEGIPFSLLLKFKFLLIKNNDGFMIIRSKPCSLELLEQVKTFMICEKIDTAIADELKIAKILNQIRIQEEIKRLSIKLRLEWQENHKRDDQSCISQIFDFLLHEILSFHASDIHIEARNDDALIRFRIDGILREFAIFEKDIYEALVFMSNF